MSTALTFIQFIGVLRLIILWSLHQAAAPRVCLFNECVHHLLISLSLGANKTKVTCTIPNCYGIGHVRWYNHKSHNTIENCPYTDKNMGKEPSDRYESDNESVESDEDVEDSENEDGKEAAKGEENDNVNEKERENHEEMSISDADEPELLQYSISLLEQENYSLQLPQSNLARCKCFLKENESEFELDKISSWDYILVERFVRVITGCQQTAAKFSYQVKGTDQTCWI